MHNKPLQGIPRHIAANIALGLACPRASDCNAEVLFEIPTFRQCGEETVQQCLPAHACADFSWPSVLRCFASRSQGPWISGHPAAPPGASAHHRQTCRDSVLVLGPAKHQHK